MGALAEARALGFLGPGPLEAHVESAEAFSAALGTVEGPALDLGSGGGVPGLLLAAQHAQARWLLLDGNRKRTSFLARTVATLGWHERVEVRRASAEVAAHEPGLRASFGTVVARSFGPPSLTAECAVGFLVPGGRLAVAEPPTSDPQRWPPAELASLGLEIVSLGRIALLELVAPPPRSVPRPLRAMQRHPRW